MIIKVRLRKQSKFRSLILFTHHLNEPFFGRFTVMITFSISSQIPRIHNFNVYKRKLVIITDANGLMLPATEFTIAYLFTSLLRFATYPTTDGSSFSTSTHIVLNVMRGHNISLCQSVIHYKTLIVNDIFIYSDLKKTFNRFQKQMYIKND